MADTQTIERIWAEAPEKATHYHTGLKVYLQRGLLGGWFYKQGHSWLLFDRGIDHVSTALENGEIIVLDGRAQESGKTRDLPVGPVTGEDVAQEPASFGARWKTEILGTFDPVALDFLVALEDPQHNYHSMARALLSAYEQAAHGKGHERHGKGTPFEKQRMQTLADGQGHPGGMIYQIGKKAQESERMNPEARKRELRGVMVYAAGAIIWTDRHDGGES